MLDRKSKSGTGFGLHAEPIGTVESRTQVHRKLMCGGADGMPSSLPSVVVCGCISAECKYIHLDSPVGCAGLVQLISVHYRSMLEGGEGGDGVVAEESPRHYSARLPNPRRRPQPSLTTVVSFKKKNHLPIFAQQQRTCALTPPDAGGGPPAPCVLPRLT